MPGWTALKPANLLVLYGGQAVPTGTCLIPFEFPRIPCRSLTLPKRKAIFIIAEEVSRLTVHKDATVVSQLLGGNVAQRVLLLFCVFLFYHSVSLSQRSRQIQVPQDKPTIQAAINASRVGDTVLVDHGLYYENVRINKNIVLASRFILDGDTAHISETIIDGSRPRDSLRASAVTIGPADTTCVLIGFTIRRGIGTFHHATRGRYNWISGGGVFISNAGARVAHNRIVQNRLTTRWKHNRTFGAGLASHDSTFGATPPSFLIIEHNVISENVAAGLYGSAGGMEIGQPGIVRHNIITDNSALSEGRSLAGGVLVEIQANYLVTLEGNYISRNAASWGGGILIGCWTRRQGRAVLLNNIIVRNSGFETGGGVHILDNVHSLLLGNTIADNRALSQGGGITVFSGTDVAIVNNIIWNNTVDQISRRYPMRAYHNVIQGGLEGIASIDEDPQFLPDDSLYRLLPNSPCLGAGIASVMVNNAIVETPQMDFQGIQRKSVRGGLPDLGAVESPWADVAKTRSSGQSQRTDGDSHLKLSVRFNQRSPSDFTVDRAYILHGGKIDMTTVVNDELPGITSPPTELSFVLSPYDNFLELEVSGRGLDGITPLSCSFRLEGRDEVFHRVTESLGSDYRNYADLLPGTYRFQFLPSDQENFFDQANRAFITIIVLPYWYTRWWAYALYALGIVSIAVGFFRSRVKRLTLQQQVALEHLQAEKLAEVDRMKSRFFANLSHEFRTPLSLIVGPAEQLETSEKDPPRKQQINLIRRNAERLLRMVNLLLQFARIESGALKLGVSLQPLPPLLRRIVSSFSTSAVKKGVALHSDIQPGSFEGYVDTEKVEHIVENVLSNAIKYTNAGGRVDLKAQRVETELVIVVSDSGIGIADDHLAHVFDRFYRVDASHQSEGTGIGLSLTKELVEFHHGSISLTSTPGVGTKVTVRLPISGYREDETVPAQELKRPESRAETGKPQPSIDISGDHLEKTIVLIVEDNDDARGYLRSRLSHEFEIIDAASGTEAVQRSRDRVPDIVVSDVMMPEMNGYELCAKLKQDERTSHIPVILLTALADQTDKIEGLQTGADDYLVKPFDAEELLVRVRNLIANRKKVQERFRTSVPLKPGEVKVESLEDKFLVKVMFVVESHISEEQFDVEQFAQEAHFSRGQLHRKLKALTNLSPTDFIRYIRLRRAKDLLEKRAGTVSEVAYQVGFSNHSYFAKCFKEQFGILPSE
ncbi:MAG: Response regulator, partial [Bacteroidetes bacterium]|nr:Response regulator [Bacteroidota bacterium]